MHHLEMRAPIFCAGDPLSASMKGTLSIILSWVMYLRGRAAFRTRSSSRVQACKLFPSVLLLDS
jgi:hypothetical protein